MPPRFPALEAVDERADPVVDAPDFEALAPAVPVFDAPDCFAAALFDAVGWRLADDFFAGAFFWVVWAVQANGTSPMRAVSRTNLYTINHSLAFHHAAEVRSGRAGCVTELGISTVQALNRSLTVAALFRVPRVCSELQSRDRQGAVDGNRFPQIG